ncbi:MAG: RHS repeat-associated core domain-containing protein [Chitinophagales bacterium]
MELFEDLDLNVNFAFYRSYDAAIGRWWQVDPKAEASKDLSPYNGMHNSPIKYSDHNGDFIPSAILGAGVGLLMNGINNVANGNGFFQGAGKAALFGALGGAASFGIGEAFNGLKGLGVELARAGVHGLSGGIQSGLAGGEFW